MSSTLTDRYVWAVARRLPPGQRDDIERELRSTIADMAETAGERSALAELGDPALFAANYRSGGRVLIGEVLYPEYVRQLRRWLVVVVPLLTALSGVSAELADDPAVGSMIVAMVGGAATAVVQVCFWVTVVFALIERFGTGDSPTVGGGWTPDDLPDVPAEPQVSVADTVGEVVTTVVLIALLFLQGSWSPVHDSSGDPVPVLDPDLWPGLMAAVVVLLVAGATIAVLAHLRGSWSWPLASMVTVIDLVLLAFVAVAAFSEQLINPAFLGGLADDLGLDTVPQPNPGVITAVVGALLLWDAWEALSAAARTQRAVA